MSKFIPNAFQIPNSVIDELLAKLTCAELKCYLFVVRKTKGWNKESDSISVSQFMEVTGLSNRSVITACESLVEMGLLERSGGERKLNTYSVKAFDISQTGEKSSSDETGEKSSSDLVKKVHTQNNNKNTIQNNNTSSSGKFSQTEQRAKKYSFSPDDMRAAEWIFELLKKLNPEFKVKSMDSWANCVRLMRERDGRTHRDICELFQWANQDPFWSLNILSPSSLREKWIQLSIKKQASERKPRRTTFQERNSTNWGTPEKMAEVF